MQQDIIMNSCDFYKLLIFLNLSFLNCKMEYDINSFVLEIEMK